jgi:5-methyltetrahydrofolate--homocysteine methyltransferase
MRVNILDSLQSCAHLSDGAIGTELQRMGLEPGACSEVWNIEQPEKIRSLHRAYVDAGAQFLTTNSFRANRFALGHYGLESRVGEFNRSAAALAREVAGEELVVMGSMGPFGGFLEPWGESSKEDVLAAFLEQARALLAGGAQAILIETMSAIEEIELAIHAAREAGAPMVFSTMTFSKAKDGYRTMMGVTPRQAATAMDQFGADVVGCNCGTDLEMEDHEQIVRQLRLATRKPILVQPNAGEPELVGMEIVYRRPAVSMAERVPGLIRGGANIVGGCCGTRPEHIRLFGEELKELEGRS